MILINRGRVMVDYLENLGRKDSYKARYEALEKAIDEAHAVDAVPVVHGRWTRDKECSECGELALYNGNEELVSSRYCPHCGAKMDGESKQ